MREMRKKQQESMVGGGRVVSSSEADAIAARLYTSKPPRPQVRAAVSGQRARSPRARHPTGIYIRL